MEPRPSDLIFGLALAFGFPIIVYLTGIMWNKMVGAPSKVNKAWASFCLLLPIVALAMFAQVGSHMLRQLWGTSPYLLSLLGVIFGILAPAALIAAVVGLWRNKPRHRE